MTTPEGTIYIESATDLAAKCRAEVREFGLRLARTSACRKLIDSGAIQAGSPVNLILLVERIAEESFRIGYESKADAIQPEFAWKDELIAKLQDKLRRAIKTGVAMDAPRLPSSHPDEGTFRGVSK